MPIDALPTAAPAAGPLLLQGGTVFGADEVLRRADVLVAEGRITAVGDVAAPDDARVIDATGRLILPGLIDTHRHTWQTAVRGIGTGWDLDSYFAAVFFGVAPAFTPEDVYIGTLLGALTALDAGVTTLVDWSHIQNTPDHSDAAVRALLDSGIRAVFAHGWSQIDAAAWVSDSTRPHPDDARRVRTELLPDDTARVTMALALRGPEFSTRETVRLDMQLAQDLGVPVTMHVGDGDYGPRYRAVATLHELGLLGPRVTLVHASTSSDDELRMIADTGARVSVSPHIETTMPGLGRPATGRLLAAGVRPSLSVDSETAVAGDLFTVMRATLAAHRSAAPDDQRSTADLGLAATALTADDVFAFATREGAAGAGLADRTGVIGVGHAADLIVVRGDDVNLAPEPTIATIVAGAHPGNVETVIVDGAVVKRDGRLTYPALDALRAAATASRRRLLAHLPS